MIHEMSVEKIAMGCDHGAFELKEGLKAHLLSLGYEVKDFGCFSKDSMDYPDTALPAAQAVAKGEADRGIVLCTTGIGVSICANKVKGIRCALCVNEECASLTRQHNDTNVLALGAKLVNPDEAIAIADIWLTTPFSQGERHQRRIDKIARYEQEN